MVIKGRPRSNGGQLASYLLNSPDNDNAYVLDIRGTVDPHNLRMSLLEMSLTSELTNSDKGLYHAQINPAYGDDRRMTEVDWLRAADILETELKLTGQKRAIVMHEKNGRLHAHVVWERYDHETGKMISDSFSRLAQDRARKIMEREFNQQRTRDRNTPKPEVKEILTKLWRTCDSGKAFITAAAENGFVIANGTERPFMAVDDSGISFNLVRQLTDIDTKEVRERLKGNKLPSEKQAIKEINNKRHEKRKNVVHETERERQLRELNERFERQKQQSKDKEL